MVDVGDLVAETHNLSLQGRRLSRRAVVQNSIPHFPGQVQALSFLFQNLHDTDALFRVAEAPGMHRIERRFPGMAERRVSEIMAERNGFGQILIQIQRPRNRAGNLGYLECVRQAGPVMISLRSEKHLCFVFHPAKGFGVENPVPVSLVDGADVTLRFISVPSSGIPAVRRIRTQLLKFPFFKRFSQVQTKTTSFPVICL